MLTMGKTSCTNRNRFEIIAQMLRQLRIPICKTNIMSRCNMNTAQSGQYLNLMKLNGLIQIEAMAGKVTYQRTQVGREFLELYNQMAMLLDPSVSAPSLIY
jgi:predicted transcriptional regulator